MPQTFARTRRHVAMVAGLRAGAGFARLRHGEIARGDIRPSPIVVTITGLTPPADTATITALLAQALNAVVPGRVTVVDADGVGQFMRKALGSGPEGDLRQLARVLRPGSPRRAVDAWLDFAGVVPLCAAGPRDVVDAADLIAALGLLRRRFTAVLVHVPVGSPADHVWWAGSTADHVVFGPDEHTDVTAMRDWWRNLRPGGADGDLTMVDGCLSGAAPRVSELNLAATAATSELAKRVTAGWRK